MAKNAGASKPSMESVHKFGKDPILDMWQFVGNRPSPLILDVGANIGQSVLKFRKRFPSSVIHSFEPNPDAFSMLSRLVAPKHQAIPWNLAVGANAGKKVFNVNDHSVMSSFLGLGSKGWGHVVKRPVVDVTTVDRFLESNSIMNVDILKCDTQGFEMEVFKGAEKSFRRDRIGLIYFECTFSDMYKRLPAFDQLFRHLMDRHFRLVSFYRIYYSQCLASWSDALFVNEKYYAHCLRRGQ